MMRAMKERLLQAGKEMGDREVITKMLAVLVGTPVIILGCVALSAWVGAYFGFLYAGVFCGVFLSMPLAAFSIYKIVVFGHKEVK